MSSRARASAATRHPVRLLLLAGALAAVGTAAVGFDASAQQDEPAGTPVRTVTVTAEDAVSHALVDRPLLASSLADALEARVELTATAPPEPEPAPEPAPDPEPAATGGFAAGVWDRLAQCESGGNWSINTGNGFYGGLQFTLESWQWVGGSGYPHEASRSEQIHRAELLHARQGWNAWPACSRKLGLR